MNNKKILLVIRYFCLAAAILYFYAAYTQHKTAYYFIGLCFLIIYFHRELFDHSKKK